jgi:hypothetical protein
MSIIIYTGQQTEFQLDAKLGMSGSIVMTLMNSYFDKCHVLFVDKWYISPALFEKLHYTRAGACETGRNNRVGLPTFPLQLQKGEQTFQHTNILLALNWRDEGDVHMLSTIDIPNIMLADKIDRATNKPIEKPLLFCIKDYNENMRLTLVKCLLSVQG